MRSLLLVPVFVLILSSTLLADLAYIPLDKRVADTDLIVVGTLHSAVEDDFGRGKGYILVDSIVTNGAKTMDGALLKVGNNLKITWADDWACVMGMHRRWENQKGVWLLKAHDNGTVTANYGGFRPLDELSKIEKLQRQNQKIYAARVDISPENTVGTTTTDSIELSNLPEAVDIPETNDYSLLRALLTGLLSLGLYWILYKSRFRIR